MNEFIQFLGPDSQPLEKTPVKPSTRAGRTPGGGFKTKIGRASRDTVEVQKRDDDGTAQKLVLPIRIIGRVGDSLLERGMPTSFDDLAGLRAAYWRAAKECEKDYQELADYRREMAIRAKTDLVDPVEILNGERLRLRAIDANEETAADYFRSYWEARRKLESDSDMNVEHQSILETLEDLFSKTKDFLSDVEAHQKPSDPEIRRIIANAMMLRDEERVKRALQDVARAVRYGAVKTTEKKIKGEDGESKYSNIQPYNTIGSRLAQLRIAAGLSMDKLARALDASKQTIYSWEKNRMRPSAENVALLATLYSVTTNYIEFGAAGDEMDSLTGTEIKRLNQYGTKDDGFGDTVFVAMSEARASAGNGQPIFGDSQEPALAFRRSFFEKRGIKSDDCKCLRVSGDSMTPGLIDGDVILIHHKPDTGFRNEAVYCIRMFDEIAVKRLRKRFEGGLTLVSDNPAYKPVDVTEEQASKHITIYGEVLWRGGAVS